MLFQSFSPTELAQYAAPLNLTALKINVNQNQSSLMSFQFDIRVCSGMYCHFIHLSKKLLQLRLEGLWNLSYEVASGSDITPFVKIDKLINHFVWFYRFW